MATKRKYAIVDVETTGGMPRRDKITEIAILIHDGTKVIDQFDTLINPERSIPSEITRITGITNDMVQNAPKFYEVAKDIIEILDKTIFVAHNVRFDYSFIKEEFQQLGFTFTKRQLCTVKLSRRAFPGLDSYSLGNLIRHFGISVNNRHRALDDTIATADIFTTILQDKVDDEEIKEMINLGIKESQLPKGISIEGLHHLPETPGIYYFYNKDGRVVYVGKAKNIKTRVFQHFNKVTTKAAKIYRSVDSITFEETGNELTALLLEVQEIKSLQPEINKALRRKDFQYFLGKTNDAEGYPYLEILKHTKANIAKAEKLFDYSKAKYGKEHLLNIAVEMDLCMDRTELGEQYMCHCEGTCLYNSPEDYEEKMLELNELLRGKFSKDFVITEQGRTRNEKCLILVKDGFYKGFYFLDESESIPDVSTLLDQIKTKEYYPIYNKLIWNYLEEPYRKVIDL